MKYLKDKIKPILTIGVLLYLISNQTPIFGIWLIGFYINVATVLYEMISNKKEFYKKLEDATDGFVSKKGIMVLVLISCLFSFLVPITSLILKNKKE